MKFFALVVLLALCASAFASFEYLTEFNGSRPGENIDMYTFSQPSGLLYAGGKLYVTDFGRSALFVMNGTVREKAVLTSGTDSNFARPLRMFYENGTVYVADGNSGKIKVFTGTSIVDTWNPGSSMQIASSLYMDKDYAYIADMGAGRLYAYSRVTHNYDHIAVDAGAADGRLESPADIHLYKGIYYVSDSAKGMIFAYDQNFTFLSSIGRGRGGITLTSPRGFDIYDDQIFVADTTSQRIVVFTLDGYPIEVLNASTAGGNFSYPEDVAVGDGVVWVADTYDGVVKEFAHAPLSGNDTVEQAIVLANYTVGQLHSMEQAAAKLRIQFSATNADEYVSEAQEDYGNFLFSSASVLAAKAKDEATAGQQLLSQAIETKVKQLVKAANDKVAPYRPAAPTGEIAAQFAQFDNKVADANAKLAARSYSSAADAANALSPAADALISAIGNKTALDQEASANRTLRDFQLELSGVSLRLSSVKGGYAAYRQEANFSNADSLIAAANASAVQGDFVSANRSISLARTEIDASELALQAISADVDSGIANITIIERGLNMTAAKTTLLPADLSQERSLIAQSYQTVYSNPQLAVAMATQASVAAESKMKDAQALSLAVASVLSIVGAIVLIAGAFWIHLMRRRSKKKSGEDEAHSPKPRVAEVHRPQEAESHRHEEQHKPKIWRDD
ncbi:NHL repeat protein [uncultured archaeon]|nr:NHL repeat protein [uncultured archaeon]